MCLSARRARLRAGIKREHGAAVAGEVEEGLELLRDAGNARACYWACPFCAEAADGAPRRFGSARAFLVHVDACHEGVQLSADGVPLLCVECSNEARRPRLEPRSCLAQTRPRLSARSRARPPEASSDWPSSGCQQRADVRPLRVQRRIAGRCSSGQTATLAAASGAAAPGPRSRHTRRWVRYFVGSGQGAQARRARAGSRHALPERCGPRLRHVPALPPRAGARNPPYRRARPPRRRARGRRPAVLAPPLAW